MLFRHHHHHQLPTFTKPTLEMRGHSEPIFFAPFATLNPPTTPQLTAVPTSNLNSTEPYMNDMDNDANSTGSSASYDVTSENTLRFNSNNNSNNHNHTVATAAATLPLNNTSETYTKLISHACEATNDEPLVRFISNCFNEEIEKRRATNRVSAKRSRDRRRIKYLKLEEENEILALKNDALSEENQRLQAELQLVHKLLAQAQQQQQQHQQAKSHEEELLPEPLNTLLPPPLASEDGVSVNEEATPRSMPKRKRIA
jgi:hypothetical protein